MTRILMIRHGQAAASFTDDADPGLSPLGHTQAEAAAEALRPELPLAMVSSPLKRAYQTAEALQAIQGGDIRIEPRVSEIPSPGLSITQRGPWLQSIMTGNWSDQSEDLLAWRHAFFTCLTTQKEDCVIFSHFVAINVAVGLAEGVDQVAIFRPDNTSVTELQTDGNALRVISRGSEAITRVN